MMTSPRQNEFFDALLKISESLLEGSATRELFERILDIAMEVSNAERGFLLLKSMQDSASIIPSIYRNFDPTKFSEEERYSIGVLEKVCKCSVQCVAIGWDRSEATIVFKDIANRPLPLVRGVAVKMRSYPPDESGKCPLCLQGLPLVDLSNPDENTLEVLRSVSHSERSPMTDTKVFISHSGRDKDLADAFETLLLKCTNVRTNQIRCTSTGPSALDPGDRISEKLRLELLAVP